MKKQYRFNKKQAGLTLIEAIVVLGILGGIVALVMYRQQISAEQNKVNDVSVALSQMIADIRTVYSSIGDFSTVTSANIANAGFVRSPLTKSGSNIVDPWGNAVVFNGTTGLFGFVIKAPASDTSACIKFVSSLAQNALQVVHHTSAPTTLGASGYTTETKIKDLLSATPIPNVTITELTNACSSVNNFIGFVYR